MKKVLKNKKNYHSLVKKEISYIFNCLNNALHEKEKYLVSHINANTGKIINNTPIFEDFGDIVPLFLLCKKKTFLKNEFHALYNHLSIDPYYSNKKFHSSNIVHTYDWSDLIYGLILFNKDKKNIKAKQLIEKYFDLIKKQIIKNKFISTIAIKFFKLTYFLPICSMNGCAMYPELLIYNRKSPNAKSNLIVAEKIIDTWTNDKFYKKYNLFPDYLEYKGEKNFLDSIFLFIFKKHIKTKNNSVSLFKQNTNSIASILSIYIITKDQKYRNMIYDWYKALKKNLKKKDNLFIDKWSISNEKIGVWHSSNFQVIDLLCDFNFYLNDKYFITEAEQIANALIKKSGKFMVLPFKKKDTNAHCDAQVDFAVSLVKLFKLTKKKKYLKNSVKIMNSVKKYFYKKYGMVEFIDTKSKKETTERCKVKFLILSLKGWLAIRYYKNIYKDIEFNNLLNDR